LATILASDITNAGTPASGVGVHAFSICPHFAETAGQVSGRGLEPRLPSGTLQLSVRCSSVHFSPRRSFPVIPACSADAAISAGAAPLVIGSWASAGDSEATKKHTIVSVRLRGEMYMEGFSHVLRRIDEWPAQTGRRHPIPAAKSLWDILTPTVCGKRLET
jgi:hypothetical protein